jgi:hypothetical protein
MKDKGLLADDFAREQKVEAGSNRAFGITIGVVLGAIALVSFLFGGSHALWWLIGGVAFAVAGLLAPGLLGPLNRLWFRFGLLLHHVVNPLVLGLMFFAVITPLGLLMRLLGKRPLNLPFDKAASSYWVRRDPPGPARDSFPNQF